VKVPAWRIALGVAVLVALAALGVALAPVYFHNLNLQQSEELQLPVHMSDVHLERTPEALRISVKYAVHVDFIVYAVDLHFYPGAGSR
jgi:hypothetical protein